MSRRLLTIAWLTVLWVVLWRDVALANLLSGVLIAMVASRGVASPRHDQLMHRVHPVALGRFALYFVWKLVEANLVLAREVVTPQNVIHTGIVAVPLPGLTDFVVTVVANAVSLTPGTLTLDVQRDPDPVLYVHVLHLNDLDDARADVERLAHRVAAAFTVRSPQPATTTAPER